MWYIFQVAREGFAKFFEYYENEERVRAKKLIKHLNERGGGMSCFKFDVSSV